MLQLSQYNIQINVPSNWFRSTKDQIIKIYTESLTFRKLCRKFNWIIILIARGSTNEMLLLGIQDFWISFFIFKLPEYENLSFHFNTVMRKWHLKKISSIPKNLWKQATLVWSIWFHYRLSTVIIWTWSQIISIEWQLPDIRINLQLYFGEINCTFRF